MPAEAKEYIEKVYEETGEVVKTEKNKEDNEPYLNPKYIEYLELSDEEKEKVELIPDIYVLDYEVNKSYSTQTLPSLYDLRSEFSIVFRCLRISEGFGSEYTEHITLLF